MAEEKQVFGFNAGDADALLDMIPAGASTGNLPPRKPTFCIPRAEAKTGGIGANSAANVYLRQWNGTAFATTSIEYPAYNDSGTAILAGDKLVLFPVDGQWLAVVTCE